ncbi:hypothetical protein AAFF_G00127910 [Aldrovandia affinis]|uniref:CHCH domain-containing protein n=1 Tax=Aldrovandia affinis TaxID=143900 RepID=A0AAD7WXB2_9TELE|nr:hypothetical protein AAFF_G00127910 [Aldrovandia affinis]
MRSVSMGMVTDHLQVFTDASLMGWGRTYGPVSVSGTGAATTCSELADRAYMASYATPHNRARIEDEEDPVDQMISRTGCGELHYAVQECMAEHQDWRKCQSQVQNFKECMLAFQNARKDQHKRQSATETT